MRRKKETMRKLLVCQHVPHEILGTLDPLFRHAGFRIRYVNFGRHPHAQPSLDGYRGLIVLGGPMNVDEVDRHPHLATEVRLIEQAVARDLPVLGICLGAQLIAKTLGARVYANGEKEIGWYDVAPTDAGGTDPLFAHFGATERVFQWHGDTFTLPAGAVHLARGDGCTQQAFRYGDKVYGLQFHLEVDEAMIARWLQVPAHRAEIASLNGRIDPAALLRDTPAYIGRLTALSDAVFGAFIKLFNLPPKRRALPSR
jgi:GMP synthase (glutamine-hydrolysing)